MSSKKAKRAQRVAPEAGAGTAAAAEQVAERVQARRQRFMNNDERAAARAAEKQAQDIRDYQAKRASTRTTQTTSDRAQIDKARRTMTRRQRIEHNREEKDAARRAFNRDIEDRRKMKPRGTRGRRVTQQPDPNQERGIRALMRAVQPRSSLGVPAIPPIFIPSIQQQQQKLRETAASVGMRAAQGLPRRPVRRLSLNDLTARQLPPTKPPRKK